MEDPYQLVPVLSLVPVSCIQSEYTLSRKYWHIICRYISHLFRTEFNLPCGLYVIKMSLFLVIYDQRLFLTVALEWLNCLPPSEQAIESSSFAQLQLGEELEKPMIMGGAIPLGYGVFQLPDCPRCLLGYSCKSHNAGDH